MIQNLAPLFDQYLPNRLHQLIKEMAFVADERGCKAVLVGGVVRDFLVNQRVKESDIMLEHPASPIVEAWAKGRGARVTFHERFLTYSVHFDGGAKFDVVTAREESYPAPARLPLVKPSTIEGDLKRRDFTINAMACWLNRERYGELIDPFSGRADLDKKIIRILHDKSFVDDPTRLYRAARFAGRLGFRLEPRTEQALRGSIQGGYPRLLSPVRRRHEFEVLMKEKDPGPALDLLSEWGALAFLHEEWAHYAGCIDFLDKELAWSGEDGFYFTKRLVRWFRQWEAEKAKKMMTDLSFEKAVKSEVLAKL